MDLDLPLAFHLVYGLIVAGVHGHGKPAFKRAGQLFPVPAEVEVPDQVRYLVAELHHRAVRRILAQRQGDSSQKVVPFRVQDEIGVLQSLLPHKGGEFSGKVVQAVLHLRGSPFHGKGEVHVFPVAVGFIQSEGKPLGVFPLGVGPHLDHPVVGAHIGAYRGLFSFVVKAERLSDQGDALRESGVGGVHPAEKHKSGCQRRG